MMIKLLLVEDDTSLAYIEKSTLEDIIGGYEVVTAENGKEGLQKWEEFKPDVIISDIDMPEMNGIEMVKRIRETDGDTIILFATALTNPKNVSLGYAVGVNNYVKKPFVPSELDSHVRGLLKMKNGIKSRNETNCYKIGKYILDAEHALLHNSETDEKKVLTVRESQILELLVQNKNEIIKREAILSRFWGVEDKDFFASRSLDVFITNIRKALKDETSVELKTVRGVGLALFIDE